MSILITLQRAVFREDEYSEPDIMINFNVTKDDYVVISEGSNDNNKVYLHKDSLQSLVYALNAIIGDIENVDSGCKD